MPQKPQVPPGDGTAGPRRPTVPGYRSAPLPPVAHPAAEPPEIPSLLPAAELESAPQSTRLEPEPLHAPRGHQRTLVGPAAPPARGAAPAPPPSERPSLRPAPWDDTTDAQIEAAKLGYRVERSRDAIAAAPATTGTAVTAPVVVTPPRPQPWWERIEDVLKLLGALGTLVGVVLGALATYRATSPPPPPPADIVCPPFADQSAARGALCVRIHQLDTALGTLQAAEAARRARDDREQRLREQEPSTLQPKAK